MNKLKRYTLPSLSCAIALAATLAAPQPARATAPATTMPATVPSESPIVKNDAGEIVVAFASAPVGKPFPEWSDSGVTFKLASPPERSRAQGRVMFFPHLKTERQGILNAMANEQAIPVKAQIVGGATSVTLVLWGTVGCHAWVEAHGDDGKLLGRVALEDTVPQRASPSDPIPSFTLSIKAENIGYILFAGAPNGGALVLDEMRFVPKK